MQFQADILGMDVVCQGTAEATALGAAYLAGLAEGVWSDKSELEKMRREGRRFSPRMDAQEREALLQGWSRAVATLVGGGDSL
jgi:glycerol kinase